MKIIRKECNHCGTPYRHTLSGHINNPELNDDSHCHECMGVILKALDSIPKKFDYRHIKTDEVSVEELLAAKNALPKTLDGMPVPRRCFPELYNLNTGEWTKTQQIPYNGTKYILCEVTKGIFTITKRVLWDIVNDKEHHG